MKKEKEKEKKKKRTSVKQVIAPDQSSKG